MKLKINWSPIIEKVQSKLSSWKSKTLSSGGRLTLVQLVIGSLPLFYFSIFKAPTSILKALEKLRRRFLWGGNDEKGKICWVTRNHVLAAKDFGGLGVGSLKSLNIYALCEWIWRLKAETNTLWHRVISGILARKPMNNLSKRSIPGIWCNLVSVLDTLHELGIDLSYLFSYKLALITGTSSVLITGLGMVSSQLNFALDKKKLCFISDKLSFHGASWN